MNSFLKAIIIIVGLPFLSSCEKIDNPQAEEAPLEDGIVLDRNGGIVGMEVLSNNKIVTYNTNSFSLLEENGELIKQILTTNHVFANWTIEDEQIFFTGRSNQENIGLSSYNLNGELLWEKFITFNEGDVERPTIKIIDGQLVMAVISTSKESTGQIDKTINVEILSKNGEFVDSSKIEFQPELDFSTFNLVIESKKNFLVQGSRFFSDSQVPGSVIQVYRFESGNLGWFKMIGPLENATVMKVVKSPTGEFLFVGSKDLAAWAFAFDNNGEKLWEFDYEDGTNNFMFLDAAYAGNKIYFGGYTNATDNLTHTGFQYSSSLTGTQGVPSIFFGPNIYRIHAVAKRNADEVIFGGLRHVYGTNHDDSWILFQ